MKPPWDDLNTRARGLATHLLNAPALAALAASPDLSALATGLRQHGYLVDPPVSAAAIELAARRMAAGRLALLGRWAGARAGVLAVVFEEEDCRNLRAVLRGVASRAPRDQQLTGLIPTPSLPERSLAHLASQVSAGTVVALLSAWRHPAAAALRAASRAAEPDLLRLELALAATFAERSLRGARHAGRGGPVERSVREVIDGANAATALVLAGDDRDLTPKEAFIRGGHAITITVFEEAIVAGTPELRRYGVTELGNGVAARLATAADGALADALRASGDDPAQFENAFMRSRIARMGDALRRSPLSPLVVLRYALQVRAEVMDVSRLAWGIALGAPMAGAPLAGA